MSFKITTFKVANANNSPAIDQSPNAEAGLFGPMHGIYALISISLGSNYAHALSFLH